MNNKIPITIPFEEDELLYSWVYRLYKANLYHSRINFEEDYFKGQPIHVDGFGFSRGLLLSSRFNKKQERVFTEHTLYPFFAIFYNKEKQEKILHLQREGFEKDSPVSFFNEEVKEIRYCPECMKEAGRKYLKRAHQLPGVKVCYKHMCKLETLEKKYNREEMKKLDEIPLITDDYYIATIPELQHANFMKDILDEAFDMTREDLNLMVLKRLKALYLTEKEDVLEFFRSYDVKITNHQAGCLLKRPEDLSEEFLQTIITPLFSSIDVFKALYEEIDKPSFNEELILRLKSEGYELVSPYKKNIMEIHHNECDTSFLITEHGLKAGIRCPFCQKLNNQELYELLFATKGDEFELLSPYEGSKNKIRVRHSCGHEFETNPNKFYYDNGGCPNCRGKLSLEEAQEKVDKVDPTYEVLDYNNLESKATFLHKVCGYKVERRFADFLRKGMTCPYCKKQAVMSKTPEFEKKMEKLVGHDYELETPFMGKRQPIKIKHKACGLTHEYKRAAYFLGGQRCPLCHGQISNDQISNYVKDRSFGNFIVTDFLPNKELEILNTVTKEKMVLKKKLVLQELEKPEISQIFTCIKDERVKRPMSLGGEILKALKENFNNKDPFNIKDVESLGFTRKQATSTIRRLTDLGLIYKKNKVYYLVQDYTDQETYDDPQVYDCIEDLGIDGF